MDWILEWITNVLEERYGKFWAWIIYFGVWISIAVFVIWVLTTIAM